MRSILVLVVVLSAPLVAQAQPRRADVAKREVRKALAEQVSHTQLPDGATVSVSAPRTVQTRTGSRTYRSIEHQRGAVIRVYSLVDERVLQRDSTLRPYRSGATVVVAPRSINRSRWGIVENGYTREPVNGGAPVLVQTSQGRGPDGRLQSVRMTGFLFPDETSKNGPQPAPAKPGQPLPYFVEAAPGG